MNIYYYIYIYIFFFFNHILIFSLDNPGLSNTFYKITNYYGSRYLTTFLSSTYVNDDPVIVEWSDGKFIHEYFPKYLYIADNKESLIKIINGEYINILMGQKNIEGFRNGDIENVLLNKSYALVLLNATAYPNDNEYSKRYQSFLFSNNNIECLYATIKNYTKCLNSTLEELKNEDIFINRNYVKLINNNTLSDLNISDRILYMFISDTGNHCIRQLNLNTAEVSTFAGICGTSGFKDGPLGVNLFNEPKGIGIDNLGNLYIYDSGNNYMRMIDYNGYVYTLIQGACFEYKMEDNIKNNYGYNHKRLLCFKNWIKTYGEPSNHIYKSSEENTCFDNIVFCPNYNSVLNYKKNKGLN